MLKPLALKRDQNVTSLCNIAGGIIPIMDYTGVVRTKG